MINVTDFGSLLLRMYERLDIQWNLLLDQGFHRFWMNNLCPVIGHLNGLPVGKFLQFEGLYIFVRVCIHNPGNILPNGHTFRIHHIGNHCSCIIRTFPAKGSSKIEIGGTYKSLCQTDTILPELKGLRQKLPGQFPIYLPFPPGIVGADVMACINPLGDPTPVVQPRGQNFRRDHFTGRNYLIVFKIIVQRWRNIDPLCKGIKLLHQRFFKFFIPCWKQGSDNLQVMFF